MIPPLYQQLFERAVDYYANCKKNGLNGRKQIKMLYKDLKQGYEIAIRNRTDLFSRTDLLVKKLFITNVFIYNVILKLLHREK